MAPPKSPDVEWSIWIFAGPGALRGLDLPRDQHERGAVLVDGAEASVAATLARVFGDAELPARLSILAEEVATPTLLELLTDRWRGSRQLWRPGVAVDAAERSPGSRDLAEFLRWAASHAPAGQRRALVLLGDTLRAHSYYESASTSQLAPGRPDDTQPQTIKIKADDDDEDGHIYELVVTSSTETDPVTGETSTTTTNSHYTCTVCADARRSIDEINQMLAVGDAEVVSDTSTGGGSEGARGAGAAQAQATLEHDSRPKPSFSGGEPEPPSRAVRRVDALLAALERVDLCLDMLVTDSCEPTVLEQLQRLAPRVATIVSAQIEAPIAAWPLADLLSALVDEGDEPRAPTPEALATRVVHSRARAARRSKLLGLCQTIHESSDRDQSRTRETADPLADRRRALARRVLRAGHDAVALSTRELTTLATHVASLGQTLAGLLERGNLSASVALRRCIERANHRYDDHLERCDVRELLELLLDSEGKLPPAWRRALAGPAAAIRACLEREAPILAHAHTLGRGVDRGRLCGLSLHLPIRYDELGSEPSATVDARWRPVLDALHYVDPAPERVGPEQQARVTSEQRMHQDMAAFRRSTRAVPVASCAPPHSRRAWAMLHYLPGDNPGGARMVSTMVSLARRQLASTARGAEIQVAALLDRPPPPAEADERPTRASWTQPDRALTDAPIPDALREHEGVLACAAVASPDGSASVLAVSLSGEVWELPPDADSLVDGERVAQLVEAGALARAAFIEPSPSASAGLEISVELGYPHHAARLLPGEHGPKPWHGYANVEQLGALDSGAETQLRGFVRRALEAAPARHVGLVICGRADFGGGFSLCHDAYETSFLTIPTIAACIRAALEASGRDKLSLLILDDPNMLTLEVAYELRELAHVLLTPTEGAPLDCVAMLRELELISGPEPWGLEARAHRTLTNEGTGEGAPYETLEARFRHAVARLAAEELIDASRYAGVDDRRARAARVRDGSALDRSALERALRYNNGPHCRQPRCKSPRLDRATIELIQRVVGTPVDGQLGADTARALFVWQGRFGLAQTGKADAETLARIRELTGQPPPPDEPPCDDAQLDEATAHNAGRGHERPFVEDLQRIVSAPVDGSLGPVTTHALFVWQGRVGLPQHGKLEPPALDPPPPPPPPPPGPLEDASDGPPPPLYDDDRPPPSETVEMVQRIVGVELDGLLSPYTTHAIMVWQQLVGLPPTGLLDPPTLALIRDFDAAIGYNRKLELSPETIENIQRTVGAPVDGIIGPVTTQAIYVWQARVGLVQDGRLEPETLALVEAQADRLPRLQAIDLELVEGLARRVDAVCRAALRELGESTIWESVRFTTDRATARHSLRSLLADLRVAAVARVYELFDPPAKSATPSVWVGKVPTRSYARLLVYTDPEPSRDYLALGIHRHVRLYALLSSYRMLAAHARHPQRLWGLVSTGIAFTPPEIRNALLSRLVGHPIDPGLVNLQFASMAAAPLITLALERESHDAEGYELRLTSSGSAALLLRQRSRVNPAGIERALAGLDFLLAGRQATRTTWRYLESLGASLGEDIINHLHDRLELERRQLVSDGRSEDAHLALAIPRELMRYPWELMLIPTGEGLRHKQMLCERFAVGRQVWSDRGRHGSTSDARDTKIKALIIGDPITQSASELPGARAEAEAIAALFAEIAGELGDEMDFEPARDVFVHATVTRDALRRLLRDGDYDIVHYAGHASFSATQPERSAWLLSDGPLWASELRNTLAWCPNPPWLVFANACHAAMTSDRAAGHYQGEVFGLAQACIQEGVAAYVAPLWQVSDEPAQVLATTVYRSLLLGRSTIGAALRRARLATRALCERGRDDDERADISWASMVLYGNPTDRLYAALGSDLPKRD